MLVSFILESVNKGIAFTDFFPPGSVLKREHKCDTHTDRHTHTSSIETVAGFNDRQDSMPGNGSIGYDDFQTATKASSAQVAPTNRPKKSGFYSRKATG